jgi:hypothetical protein
MVLVALMAVRNSRLMNIGYALAAVVFLLLPHSQVRVGRGGYVIFYALVTVVAYVVGGLLASGVLSLPSKQDVTGVRDVVTGAEPPPPPGPVPTEDDDLFRDGAAPQPEPPPVPLAGDDGDGGESDKSDKSND